MQNLTKAEEKIMEVIWEQVEPMNVYELQHEIEKRFEIHWKPQTICTFIERMKGKGLVKSEKKGRFNYYYPLLAKQDYVKALLQEICDVFQLPAKEVIAVATKDL